VKWLIVGFMVMGWFVLDWLLLCGCFDSFI